jgi:HIP---CoA ligase
VVTAARGDLAWRSVPRLGQLAAERYGGAEAVVDGHVRLTFVELAALAHRATRAALALGVQPGDRVAVWAPNGHEWIAAALGIQGAGGVLVPVNTRFKGAEAAFVLRRCGASALFATTEFLGADHVAMLREADPTLEALDRLVVLRGPVPSGALGWDGFLDAGDAIDPAVADVRIAAVDGDDLADVMFTSGTTGRPKGVMTTHAQNLRAYDGYTAAVGLREGDRYLIVNPFFHAFGYKAGWMACLLRGATAVPQAVFDVDAVLRAVERERITVLPGPPTLLQSILDHPQRDEHDLSSLRFTATGAAAIPVSLVERLRTEMSFEVVLTGYGLTETSGVVSVAHPDDDAETIARWSGRVIPDVEVRVVDDTGVPVPSGEPGEIQVRGYVVMQGYWDEPEQTAATIDADGWLRTGDIGVLRADGCVRITDRKKDMFIVGGFNAYPAEIEELLRDHPSVGRVAVVGMPDARLGEVGAAFVVPRAGEVVDADALIAWARGRMANYKVPRLVRVVDDLPVNAGGKVAKDELRALLAALR